MCYSMADKLGLPDEFYEVWEHPYWSSMRVAPRLLGIGGTVEEAWDDAATFGPLTRG